MSFHKKDPFIIPTVWTMVVISRCQKIFLNVDQCDSMSCSIDLPFCLVHPFRTIVGNAIRDLENFQSELFKCMHVLNRNKFSNVNGNLFHSLSRYITTKLQINRSLSSCNFLPNKKRQILISTKWKEGLNVARAIEKSQ